MATKRAKASNGKVTKTPAAKAKTAAKKAAAKEIAAKKVAAKKPVEKKMATKKAAAKKAVTKKPAAKKAAAKKPAAKKKVVAKTPARHAAAKVTTLRQKVRLPAPPDVVWDHLMDPEKHAAFTGGPATGEAVEGAAFTAWDGYIFGRNEELEPGERIVQSWSTTEWPAGAPPSRLELTLEATRDGTLLTMVHSEVPAEQAALYDAGWRQYYWEPLASFLAPE